jgi:hypothetical protein
MTAVCYGLDLFSGNGAIDLAKARTEDNIQFLFRKATQGLTYDDAGFAADFDRCTTLGIQPGAYHFAHNAQNTPGDEAAHFLRTLAGRRGLLALDLEDQADGKTVQQRADWATAWLSIVHQATGIRPFIYTYHSWAFNPAFAQIRAAYPLWVPLDPSQPGEIVQAVHAVGTIGTLDVDTFLGTLDDLRQLAGLTTPVAPSQPASTPTPAPPPIPYHGKAHTDMAHTLIVRRSTGEIFTVSEMLDERKHIVDPATIAQLQADPDYETKPLSDAEIDAIPIVGG